jgi:hypothetical protein
MQFFVDDVLTEQISFIFQLASRCMLPVHVVAMYVHACLHIQDCCDKEELPDWGRKSALCSYNLHSLSCWVTDQVKQRGFTGNNLELWLERLLGQMARCTKFAVHSKPEITIVHFYLVTGALESLELKLAGTPLGQRLLDYEEWREEVAVQTVAVNAAGMFDVQTSGQPWLCDRGTVMSSSKWESLEAEVRSCLQENGRWEQWQDGWPDSVDVWKHKKAILVSGQQLASTAGSARTRDGTHFLVYYVNDQEQFVPYAARALSFLRLQDRRDAARVERFVLADFCELKDVVQDDDWADMLLQGLRGRYNERNFPVLLDMVQAPMQVADRRITEQRSNGRGPRARWYRMYMPCHFRSSNMRSTAAKRHSRGAPQHQQQPQP